MKAIGFHGPDRGTNLLDTGAHFYDVYECSDGEYVSIGSIEPQFYAELLRLSGLGEDEGLPHQMDKGQWPALKEKVAALFRTKSRAEWCEIMEHTDVCFAPVLSLWEAPEHPHNVERGTFMEVGGVVQPSPAPRFSRTPGGVQRPPAHAGQHTDEILTDWGFAADDIAKLRSTGAIA
jgi:alpha-methylacyl-CoA racemase